MFNIDFSSKRAKLALRFFTYGVMTISTVVISTIMIFFALGYRLDKDLNFTQGGLVQFMTFPENAEITVDGRKQSSHTPGKANLFTGQHNAKMSLTGYKDWTKTFDVAAGELLWLNYARLIPNDVKTTNVRDFDGLAYNLTSPDKRWIVLQQDSKMPNFVLADASDDKQLKFSDIQIPDSVITKKDGLYGTFKVVEWDLKSQYILIKHQNADETEFISFDRSKPNEAVNLTRIFGLSISEAHFSGNNSNIIFANTSGVLRRLDVGNKNASGVLVDKLNTFIVYGDDTIAYTSLPTPEPGAQALQIIGIWKNNKTTIVRTFNADDKVVFNYNEYDDHEYLAVGRQGLNTVNIIRDPAANSESTSAIFAQFDLGMSPKWISSSNNGRMVTAQNNNTFATYDLEESRSYTKTLDLGAEVTNQLQWLDDYYMWADVGGTLRVFEFDGANQNDITQVTTGQNIMLSNNGKSLFSVGLNSATGKQQLQSSDLVVGD